MKARHQEESVPVSLSMVSLYPAAKVCGTFGNRILIIYFLRSVRAMTIKCIVLMASEITMTNNLQESIPYDIVILIFF